MFGYACHHCEILLPEEICYALREDDTDSFLKLLAMQGGIHFLEGGIRFLTSPPPVIPKQLRELPSSELREILIWLNFKASMLLDTCNPQTDWGKLKLLLLLLTNPKL